MLPIGVISKQTGIGIHTLRKWESRYGYPLPMRTDSGQRYYSAHDLQQLIIIQRLIENGVATRHAIQQVRENKINEQAVVINNEQISSLIDALLDNEIKSFYQLLEHHYTNNSIMDFIELIAIPLIGAVGDYWKQGKLPPYREHLFATCLTELLCRNTSKNYHFSKKPQILLATPAQERHFLAVEMLSALLIENGYPIIKLGPDLAISDIIEAALSFKISTIALSVSVKYPPRLLKEFLIELRSNLPVDVQLWLGGAGAQKIEIKDPGIHVMNTFQEALEKLKQSKF